MRLTILILGIFALVACTGSPPAYVSIKPVYQVRNSPHPVPLPKTKPDPRRLAVAHARAAITPKVKPRIIAASVSPAKPQTVRPQHVSMAADKVAVLPEDTVSRLARRHQVSPAALIAANNLTDPNHLQVGQQLRLPDTSAKQPAKSEILIPAPKGNTDFRWPVLGTILSGFGPKGGGLHNDGVNIRVAAGTPIRAAEQGVVIHAGSDLEAFGNLLLIRHANGFVTVYAHADRLLVGRGTRVRQGEIIAHAGQTGNVSEPQLHFEIRKGRKAINPKTHLPTLTAARN